MKKLIVIIFSITVLFNCKNESEKEVQNSNTDEKGIVKESKEKTAKQKDGLTLLKGEFLYMADAAVLQTRRDVYAVVIDAKMHELNDKAKAYKNEDTDMVPVVIRGKIFPKPENEEGWNFRVEIKEIISVTKPSKDDSDVIKLGN